MGTNSLQQGLSNIDTRTKKAMHDWLKDGETNILPTVYFSAEAEKQQLKFKASRQDDEKEKITERMLLDEFERISPVLTREYLSIYLKYRLDSKYTSSKLRSVWDLVSVDKDSYGINSEPTIINTWFGLLDVVSKTTTPRPEVELKGAYDKIIPHYDETATAPNFKRVLSELNTKQNPTLGEDLLKMYAYCAFGGNKLKTMFILLGDGDDGKSLIQNALRNALGDYVAVVPPKKIRYNRNRDDQFQTWLANMDGKKFAIVSEWGEADRLDNAIVKQVVSGGGSVAELEQKNKNEQKAVKLTAPFIIDTNFLPDVTNVEPALIKRLAVLRFHRQYTDDEKDITLDDKLASEKAGILNMLIDAYDPNWRVPDKYRTAIREEQAEQQADVDEIFEYALKQGGFAINLNTDDTVERTEITQDGRVKQILRDNHLKIKDLHGYLIAHGVKENRRAGRVYQYIEKTTKQFADFVNR